MGLKYIARTFIFLLSLSALAQPFLLTDSLVLPPTPLIDLQTNSSNAFLYRDNQAVYRWTQDEKNINYQSNGFITQLDASNPLRTYLFTDYNQLIILDQHLNLIQSPIPVQVPNAMPLALKVVDNQYLWFYNSLEENIIYYNYQLQKVILKTKNVAFKSEDQSIVKIHNDRQLLYLMAQQTIYTYDDLGNFRERIPFNSTRVHQFLGHFLYFIEGDTLKSLNLRTHEITSLQNFYSIKYFTMSPSHLFVLTNKVAYIYHRKTE